jgi:hypothetical protein
MSSKKEITLEALQEMEERLDQYFAVLDRPNRLENERCPVTKKSKKSVHRFGGMSLLKIRGDSVRLL